MNLRRRLASLSTLCLTPLLIAAPSSFAQSGPVAAYGFEEATGTAVVDSSGTGNAGTLSGATRTASGRFGRALSFDGVNDRVNVPDAASLDLTSGMTLEAWLKPTASNWRTALLKERPGGLAYALYASTDTNHPSTEAAGGETRGPSALANNQWSHLAATYDGATLRLYVNGSQVSSHAGGASITTSNGALRIGGNAVWGEYFKGLIDEVRVYNRALSATEVAADMGRPVLDTTAPSAPGTLIASVDDDDIDLAWGAATDDVAVTGYRVYRDGALLGTTTETTYSDLGRPAGTFQYKVVAIDAAGHAGPASNQVAATVQPDTTAPTVTLPNLCNGATIHDFSYARVRYTDDRGPVTLRVEVDGNVIYGPVTSASLSATNFFGWDTRTVANGSHTMVAYAVDGAGNQSVSAACEWNVQNPVIGLTLDAPHDGDTVSGTVTLAATPLGDGLPSPTLPVDFVVFSIDGAEFPPDFSAPYTVDWDTTAAPNGIHTVKAAVYWIGYATPRATATATVTVNN